MKGILKHLPKKDWLLTIVTILLVAGSVWFDLKLPDYMQDIVLAMQTNPDDIFAAILIIGVKMLLCALGSLLVSIAVIIFSAKISADYSYSVREKLYSSVQNFSLYEINKFSTASLITRSTNDVTQVQNILSFGLHAFVKAPIMAVFAILKIANKQWQWTFTTGCAIVFVCIILVVCYLFALPRFKKIQTLTDNINRVTRENLTGLKVIRAYNAENFQKEKFEKANDEITNNNLVANRVMALMGPSMMFAMNTLAAVVYLVGAFVINSTGDFYEKGVLFSEMIAFSAYAMQVIMSFIMLNVIFIMAPRAIVASNRINEVIDTKPSITDGPLEESPSDKAGEVEFKNVSFKYPDASGEVLSDITFSAHKGETVAIIGSTGCGKSTLINLIPRLFDVTSGEVLVDGVNVKEYKLNTLHNKVGYISQKALLFSGTINTNVAFGSNGTKGYEEEDVKEAVEIACATPFVEAKPGGFEASVSQGGANVSGGQKQRLSIARAVCRKPEILIFDDSFSALDYKTDKKLRSSLKNSLSGTTNIIVAQRIGTIKDADQIIVLDEGKIVGLGKHKDLLKNCNVYKEIALSQLSEEELAQ